MNRHARALAAAALAVGIGVSSAACDFTVKGHCEQAADSRITCTASGMPDPASPPFTVPPAPTTTTPAPPTTTTPAPPAAQPTIKAFVTGYSYFDNTPPGSPDISNPVIHKVAGGTGTFADPITVAVGHNLSTGKDVLDWPAGTRFYVPNLRRYLIVEDTCGDGGKPQNGPCHVGYPAGSSTWLDVWVDGRGGTSAKADACMDAITDVWAVIKDPRPNYAVAAGPIAAGGCTQYGNAVVTA